MVDAETKVTNLRLRLERGLMFFGALLVLYFVGQQMFKQDQVADALQHFDSALPSVVAAEIPVPELTELSGGIDVVEAAPESQTVAVVEPANPEGVAIKPNMALWSEHASKKYQEGLSKGALPPVHAVLVIPSIDLRVPVYNGASDHNLDIGVARVVGTGDFEYFDNVAIAGHRDSFFRRLAELKHEQKIVLQLPDGRKKNFTIREIKVVVPEDKSVLEFSDDESVTLVTCYPFYFLGNAPKRYIVKAVAT